MLRTNTCGELTSKSLDQEVVLSGWVAKRRDHGGLIFIDLRDRYGITQVVFDPGVKEGKKAHELAGGIRSEFVLSCRGKVRNRPDGMRNEKIKTGEIEVLCAELEILSEAKTPPFQIESQLEVSENLRLKYRYLDLRRPSLQENLITRSKMVSAFRKGLEANRFLEIETPILYKSTPEGARDFIVPSRLTPGTFYALPQSPQTLKQLLMVSGFDRYYQIARCFRDEDLRADRQPEFSQVDIEASFETEESFMTLIEGIVVSVWQEVLGLKLKTPFRRMKYQEAMDRFGTDRPDLRFELELRDLSSIFEKSEFNVFKQALEKDSKGRCGSVRALHLVGQADKFSRKDLDELQKVASTYGAKGLLWIKVQSDGTLQSPAAKFFTDDEKKSLSKRLGLKGGDLVLAVADHSNKTVCTSLGALRLVLGQRLGLLKGKESIEKGEILWVTHFPLLEYDRETSRFYAAHHPFTAPRPESLDDFVAGKNLENVLASAYDLVLNGWEIAGGSLRIHQKKVQDAMFRALKMNEAEAEKKFGFFLEALQYGTPPHGGIAFGVERLIALFCETSAIREVMAFPKTQKGQCVMSDAPSTVDAEQLVELGVSLTKREK